MSSQVFSNRNPHPFPKLQNDEDFAGICQTEKLPYDKPTHLAQREDPWNRLNSTCTLSSARREVMRNDPNAPNDSLDFVIKAEYNHHREFQKAKNEVLFQPETLGFDHGRQLKNRATVPVKKVLDLNHPLEIFDQQKKESIHSVKNAIESHHTQTTNKGYSRKVNGGFYTSI